MKEIMVEKGSESYKVYMDSNLDKFSSVLEENNIKLNNKIFIITDNRIYSIYEDYINMFTNKYSCKVYYFNEGENSKNVGTVNDIYNFLIDNSADRESILIALGGGVVGDIVGFVASTYMRGIRFINIPTTVISQVDSCIGGKTGFNHKGIKNIIGSFYDPILVYVSTSFLRTIEKPILVDGLGEVIKYGLIKDYSLLQYISQNYKKILEYESDELLHLVCESLKIKAETVKEDYNDTGMRNILNFGHTVGHGIELDSKYTVSHGAAVALGMLVALKLSEQKLDLKKDVYNTTESLFKKIGLPLRYKIDNLAMFLYAINHDKKNAQGLKFVLLEDISKCRVKVDVTEKELINAIRESIE